MTFEQHFDELDRMILTKSPDYEKMRESLQAIRRVHEIARMFEPAQDNLYASIAHGHRTALEHLESGDTEAARREMAGALSWFMRRFQGLAPEAFAKCPKVGEELRAARELADRCEALRKALIQYCDIHSV